MEILPPAPNGVVPLGEEATSFSDAWQRATHLQKGMFGFLSFGTVASVSSFALGQFFQIRGVQSVLTSRVFLFVAVVFPIAGIWQFAYLLKSRRWKLIAFTVTTILVVAILALDREFPMPKISVTDGQQPPRAAANYPSADEIASAVAKKVPPTANFSAGDKDRLAKALLDVSQVAFEADGLCGQAKQAKGVKTDLFVPLRRRLEHRRENLEKISASAVKLESNFHDTYKKWHDYDDQMKYIFGDDPFSAMRALGKSAHEYKVKLDNALNLSQIDELSLEDIKYDDAIENFETWDSGFKDRLEETRKSIKGAR